MDKVNLRAVGPDETAPPSEPMTVAEAAASGSRRDVLIAMRDVVAVVVDDPGTPARDLAALTRRLLEITKEIEALDAADREGGSRGPAADEPFDAAAV